MTELDKGKIRLRADFNSVRDGATIVGRFDFTSGGSALPNDGDRVEVFDLEGNRCLGDVVGQVAADQFRVLLDYPTWKDAPDEADVSPTADLLSALRKQVANLTEARARHQETGDEKQEVEDFMVTYG